MSFPVYFYKFNKKPNSTKQPPSTGGVAVECDIFEPCSMSSPTLKLELGMDLMTKYTYAVIPIWGKSYFVQDWGWNEGFITVTLQPDPMGYYKSFIVDRSQYILRSTVNYNVNLIDSTYPAIIQHDSAQVVNNTVFTKSGVYVLAVAGKQGSKYYILASANLSAIMSYMFNVKQDTLWETVVNATVVDITKTYLNAFEYIRGCFWLPVAWDAAPVISEISLGYWDTGVSGQLAMPPQTKSFNLTIALPQNPYATGTKYFLKAPPYTTYTLYVPFCGTYQLDSSLLINSEGITILIDIDVVGNIIGRVTVGATNSPPICVFRGNCATELQLSQSGISVARAGQALSQIATGAVTANPGLTASGIVSATEIAKQDVTSVGGIGGYAEVAQNQICLTGHFYDIAAPSSQPPGHPCCKTLSPSSNGWYQCADAQIDWIDEMYEYDTVKNYMDTGFWVE